MASWVTHLMVADMVLEQIPGLHRKGFCVGSIAPDCNVENEDWSDFVPPRHVTHWMTGEKKQASDCDRFVHEYIHQRKTASAQEEGFLWGYYAHLVTDAEFQRMIRDEARVQAMWERIRKHPELSVKAGALKADFDGAKTLISREDRLRDLNALERRYLDRHPSCGFLTEIIGLKAVPDYIDYLPEGAIVRKIGIMGTIPDERPGKYPYICISEDEYMDYIEHTAAMVAEKINGYRMKE